MAQEQPQGQAQEPDIFDRMAAQAAGVEASPLLSKEKLPALSAKAFEAQNPRGFKYEVRESRV